MANKIDWKKVLQAGALATDALSKGSAGGLGKAIVDSKIDLSGKGKNTTDINPTDEQKTENAAGGDLTEFQKKKKILNPTVSDPYGKNKTNYYG